MWKVGDLVKQRVSILRVDEVAGKPMIIIEIRYPRGDTTKYPDEIVTQCGNRFYRWNPDQLVPYGGPYGEWSSRTIHGGSSWD